MKLSDEHKDIIITIYKQEIKDFISVGVDELLSENSIEHINTGYRYIIFAIERDLAYKSQFKDFSASENELLELLSNSSQNEYLRYSDHLVNEFKDVLKEKEEMLF